MSGCKEESQRAAAQPFSTGASVDGYLGQEGGFWVQRRERVDLSHHQAARVGVHDALQAGVARQIEALRHDLCPLLHAGQRLLGHHAGRRRAKRHCLTQLHFPLLCQPCVAIHCSTVTHQHRRELHSVHLTFMCVRPTCCMKGDNAAQRLQQALTPPRFVKTGS